MKLRRNSNVMINAVGFSLTLISIAVKLIKTVFDADELSYVYLLCHIAIFVLWEISVYWRVVQKNIRKYLLAIGGMEIFWLSLRLVKYNLLTAVDSIRYAWYLYYLPLLLIPSYCMILAFSIGRAENSPLIKKMMCFPAVSAILFVLVITNDIHGLVFNITMSGMEGMDVGNYTYDTGYFIILAYIMICAAAALCIMIKKCRSFRRSISSMLPILPIIICIVICIFYIRGIGVFFEFYHIDITFVTCIGITAVLEACIQNGMIRTNTGYEELFSKSSTGMEITDENYNTIMHSQQYIYPACERSEIIKNPVMINDTVRLSAFPIKYGNVFWEDDLFELIGIIRQVEELNEYLTNKNSTLRKDYAFRKKEHQLAEKNRLYNTILNQSQKYIEQYGMLVEQLAAEDNPEKIKKLAAKTDFVLAFIKRRINIIFLSEEDENIDCGELYYCIEESLKTLRLSGVKCECISELKETVDTERITYLYESFFRFVSDITDDISSLNVYLRACGGKVCIIIHMISRADLSGISGIQRDGDRWVFGIE